jgi:sugar lactone lactonase YvrE
MGLPIGVNGIAFTRGDTSLVAVNTADGTVISIPVLDDGTAGTAFVTATGLVGADGVALDVKQNIYVAVNVANQIAVLSPSGTLLATYGAGGDPLRNPASLVFIERTLYLTDLAFFIPGATPGLSKMAVRFSGLPLSSPGDDGNHEES